MSAHTIPQRQALRYATIKTGGDREVRAAEVHLHASSSTPALQRIGETPQVIYLALLIGLAILCLAACGNFRPSTQHPASTMTLPNTKPDCVREHRVQQTGTLGAYGTPVVVVTDEPCRRPR
ncbi:hypothetical protein IM816_05705 [Luteibacter flocculans]|uniref:Lipoprotein n=1 Tax=Luteibacter flocculans TaxID=2780091 RepID=A0ABY4T3X4_9GAMM|nr:hypothetical protein [Luteibacter flocculans]URL59591.1 hypothetical protein IM816_05705 [Luteibacter flocculans]